MYNTDMNVASMYRIMIMLIAEGKLSRAEIAKRTGISERSVQRYVTALADAGIPVISGTGKHGGYGIDPAYRLTGVLVTEEDITRIRTCLSALRSTFRDELTSEIEDKLSALAGGAPSGQLVVDFDNWNGKGRSAKEDAVRAAIANSVTVEMEYTDKGGTTSVRAFDPYCIALKEGVRYVYGKCRLHGDFRLFRLARIRSVALTDRRFERSEEADVRSALMIGGDTVTLELELDESARAGMEEWLGSDCVEDADPPKARAEVYGGRELIRKILSFGSAVKVLSPASVASAVREEAAKIAGSYSVNAEDDK